MFIDIICDIIMTVLTIGCVCGACLCSKENTNFLHNKFVIGLSKEDRKEMRTNRILIFLSFIEVLFFISYISLRVAGTW